MHISVIHLLLLCLLLIALVLLQQRRLLHQQQIAILQRNYQQTLNLLNWQLQHQADSLAREVEIRTAEMAEQTKEAIRANQAKTRFLAAASHDLRQPLNALNLFVEALQTCGDSDDAHHYIMRISQTLESLTELLNSLLDISRLDAGAIQVENTAFSADRLICRLSREFEPLAHQAGLDWQCNTCEAWINTDPMLLERLLRNLLSNSLKFTHQGYIRLTCECDTLQQQVRIMVSDSGIGIPEEQQSAIFTEFYQLHMQTGQNRQSQSLGLGLSIVKRLADLLGCQLHLKSGTGTGTSFIVQLALTAPRPISAKPLVNSDISIVTGTVLLVDDDPMIMEGMSRLLTQWGHQVIAATSAQQALQLMQQTDMLDLLITDYHLNEHMNGLMLIQHLQEHRQKTLPTILITGDISASQYSQNSKYHVLHKPIKPAQLRKLVNHSLNQKINV